MLELEVEFNNLLVSSASRWTELLIEGRTWTNIALQNSAWQANIDRMRANGAAIAIFQSSDSDDNESVGANARVEPLIREQTWSLWVTPERRRARFVVGDEIVDVVIEGSTFWSNGNGRSFTNGGRKNSSHGQGDGQNLLRTADYVGRLRVAELTDGTKCGRPTLDAKVEILDNSGPEFGPDLHGLTIGDADYLELSVDRERGVLLSASSWLRGDVYRIVEMTRVEFDPNFDPDAFIIQPEFGTQWTSA
jgi:hypothetical protein